MVNGASEVTARQLRDGASLIRRCGMFGLIGVPVFWGGQAALHALRTDLSVVNDYVSDYANGPWGPLFTVATLVHGVGNLAIAAGLGYALGSARAARAGVLLFTVAAFGLVGLVIATSRRHRAFAVAAAVAAYITAAYWFTSSTSFANPAVTIARSISDTFTGIRPVDVPGFIAPQILGGIAATYLFHWLVPKRNE